MRNDSELKEWLIIVKKRFSENFGESADIKQLTDHLYKLREKKLSEFVHSSLGHFLGPDLNGFIRVFLTETTESKIDPLKMIAAERHVPTPDNWVWCDVIPKSPYAVIEIPEGVVSARVPTPPPTEEREESSTVRKPVGKKVLKK